MCDTTWDSSSNLILFSAHLQICIGSHNSNIKMNSKIVTILLITGLGLAMGQGGLGHDVQQPHINNPYPNYLSDQSSDISAFSLENIFSYAILIFGGIFAISLVVQLFDGLKPYVQGRNFDDFSDAVVNMIKDENIKKIVKSVTNKS